MKSEARKKKLKYYKLKPEQEKEWARKIGEFLLTCYPGHVWAVTVISGVAQIRNFLLSGVWGFQIPLDKIDPEMKVIMRAGGEVLERYNQRRGWADREACYEIKRDWKGEKLHD